MQIGTLYILFVQDKEMIDIILCCYNQEKTIEKALLSIYSQVTSEKANLIIADDSSADKTLEIIKRITPPDWINQVYLEKENNLGFVKNYKRAFNSCHSDFVFILEGDDYWHSPNHIEQHLVFLRENIDISMSMNRLTLLYENSGKIDYSYWDDNWGLVKKWTLAEQIYANRLGNLSGCCFRGELIRKLPKKLFDIYFADWLLGMIMAQDGNIAIFKETTSTYRICPNGQWSRMTQEEQRLEMLKCADIYEKYFDFKYKTEFEALRARLKK